MNRGSLKTRFISEVDGDDSENLQKNCYVALLLGAVASIIMLFIGFFVGFICHPFETISNLVFPIYFMAPSGIFTFGGYHREMWWNYLLHTNFFASLWDLIWNSIIMPLGEIFK